MSLSFEVESFEHVAVSPGTVLLRVSGRWRAEARGRLSPPALVVDDGRTIRRLTPLPGPDEAAPPAGPEPPVWRAAFTAREEWLAGHVAFAIDAGRDGIVDLPRPVVGRRRVADGGRDPDRPADPPAAPRDDRAELERALHEAQRVAERERLAREDAAQAAEEARTDRRRALDQASRAAADAQAAVAELGALRERLRNAEAARAAVESELAAAQAEHEEAADIAQRRVDELQDLLEGERDARAAAEQELAEMAAALEEAERRAAAAEEQARREASRVADLTRVREDRARVEQERDAAATLAAELETRLAQETQAREAAERDAAEHAAAREQAERDAAEHAAAREQAERDAAEHAAAREQAEARLAEVEALLGERQWSVEPSPAAPGPEAAMVLADDDEPEPDAVRWRQPNPLDGWLAPADDDFDWSATPPEEPSSAPDPWQPPEPDLAPTGHRRPRVVPQRALETVLILAGGGVGIVLLVRLTAALGG